MTDNIDLVLTREQVRMLILSKPWEIVRHLVAYYDMDVDDLAAAAGIPYQDALTIMDALKVQP